LVRIGLQGDLVVATSETKQLVSVTVADVLGAFLVLLETTGTTKFWEQSVLAVDSQVSLNLTYDSQR